jgi:hypothetical protein
MKPSIWWLQEILPTFALDCFQYISSFISLEELSAELDSCQIELFLVDQNEPKFVLEIFPQFKGVNLENFYGSYITATIPVVLSSKGLEKLTPAQRNRTRFGSIALTEHMELVGKPFCNIMKEAGEPDVDEFANTFLINYAEDEWKKESTLWFLKETIFKYSFVSNFSSECLMNLGHGTRVLHIEKKFDFADQILGSIQWSEPQ